MIILKNQICGNCGDMIAVITNTDEAGIEMVSHGICVTCLNIVVLEPVPLRDYFLEIEVYDENIES